MSILPDTVDAGPTSAGIRAVAAMGRAEPPAAPRLAVDASVAAPTADRRRPPLLLVEDDEALRTYLVDLLGTAGFAVQAVGDVSETLIPELADGSRPAPELVVTDLRLPSRGGLDLIAAVRSQERTERIPVVVLTGLASAETLVEVLAAGADDYVSKPFSPAELVARVVAHHQLSRLRESALVEARSTVGNLRTALESNRTIGTAVGIVMTRQLLTAADAFGLLVQISQNSNRKVRDVAETMVLTGALPV